MKFFCYVAPLLVLAAQIALEFTPISFKAPFHDENGLHELLEAALVGAGCIVALVTLPFARTVWLKAWLALAALCCFYVAGEEVSWGQHFFDWNTPEYWQGLNDQGETNLHNTSSWLDQKPRLILMLGIGFAGLLLPFYRRFAPLPAALQRFTTLLPSGHMWVIALIGVALPFVNDGLQAILGHPFFYRDSEVQELFFFYYVLLYLLERRPQWAGRAVSS